MKLLRKLRQGLKKIFRRLLFQNNDRPSAVKSIKEVEWSIGIYFGRSLFHFFPPEIVTNPVLRPGDVTDVQASLVADPFMLKVGQTWYLFFEVISQQTSKGEIGLAMSGNGLTWKYQKIILAETFHLSYPYVFKWENEFYMIPESYQANSIRLYKALHFPTEWLFIKTLLVGRKFCDASIFRHDEKWWLFTETSPEEKHDTLRLYYSEDLTGPWIEHPKSPVVERNPHVARPGGRVVASEGRIIRYTQDCLPYYGTKVWAFEIDQLTTKEYHEKQASEDPILKPFGDGWNSSGMHHIDPHLLDDGSWIACVDGWRWVDSPN